MATARTEFLISPDPFAVLDLSEYYASQGGGVRSYLDAKAAYIGTDARFRHILVVPGARTQRQVAGTGVRYSVRSPLIPGQAPYRFLWNARAVRDIIRRERPDVIEVGSAYLAPWMVRGLGPELGAGTVWYCHGHISRIVAPLHDQEPGWRGVAGLAVRKYALAIARSVDSVFVASEFVADDLRQDGAVNVRIVPLGVDTELFAPASPDAREAARTRYGLHGTVALYTGRLTTEKELDVVIDAWRRLGPRVPTLMLVGGGPLQARLALHAAGLPVRFLPFVADRREMAALYHASDFYVAPGPVETFGLSAHEAMASGLPVISVNCGAVAQAVRASGGGLTFARGSAEGLAAAVGQIIRSGPGDMGARACEHVNRHHRAPHAFATLLDAYLEVTRSVRGRGT